jgi:hypothetical protein
MKSLKLFPAFALSATLFIQTLSANNIENAYDFGGTTIKIAATTENVIVNLGAVGKEEVTIKIVNNDETILMTETVKNVKDFGKKYNVKALENGKYRLIVTKKTIRTEQPFTVHNGVVSMSQAEQKEKFLPTVNFHDDKLDVNVLLGNYSNIIVTLYDENGKEVMSEKHYVQLQLNQRYNVSKLTKGTYIASVKAGDETFTYSFSK